MRKHHQTTHPPHKGKGIRALLEGLSPEQRDMLGKVPDGQVADFLGVTRWDIVQIRKLAGISPWCRGRPRHIDLQNHFTKGLGHGLGKTD